MNHTTTLLEYAFSLFHKERTRHVLFWTTGVFLISLALLLKGHSPMFLVLIPIGIISMLPQVTGWLGIELCFLFTVFASMHYGFVEGLIIGKVVNTTGMFITGQLDHTIMYDLFAFTAVAGIASFFTLDYLLIVGLVLLIVYHLGYFIYQSTVIGMNVEHALFITTNILFNVLVFYHFSRYLFVFM
jgi:hypothetical protein